MYIHIHEASIIMKFQFYDHYSMSISCIVKISHINMYFKFHCIIIIMGSML